MKITPISFFWLVAGVGLVLTGNQILGGAIIAIVSTLLAVAVKVNYNLNKLWKAMPASYQNLLEMTAVIQEHYAWAPAKPRYSAYLNIYQMLQKKFSMFEIMLDEKMMAAFEKRYGRRSRFPIRPEPDPLSLGLYPYFFCALDQNHERLPDIKDAILVRRKGDGMRKKKWLPDFFLNPFPERVEPVRIPVSHQR